MDLVTSVLLAILSSCLIVAINSDQLNGMRRSKFPRRLRFSNNYAVGFGKRLSSPAIEPGKKYLARHLKTLDPSESFHPDFHQGHLSKQEFSEDPRFSSGFIPRKPEVYDIPQQHRYNSPTARRNAVRLTVVDNSWIKKTDHDSNSRQEQLDGDWEWSNPINKLPTRSRDPRDRRFPLWQ